MSGLTRSSLSISISLLLPPQDVRMAQWIRRLPTEQEILGSSPSTDSLFCVCVCFFFLLGFLCPSRQNQTASKSHPRIIFREGKERKTLTWCCIRKPCSSGCSDVLRVCACGTKSGVMRESNSRPPAPEAGIIPLDQSPRCGQDLQKHPTWQRPATL